MDRDFSLDCIDSATNSQRAISKPPKSFARFFSPRDNSPNPGITNDFNIGDLDTFEVFGTPNCGKGEPNQVERVGHASPICLFDNVEIFGGA